MKFTILGSTGFIGSALTQHLRQGGHEVETPPRGIKTLKGSKPSHVIYAIGLTGDFREKPRETVGAHVSVLQNLLEGAEYDSWLYLSSARVYGTGNTASEAQDIAVRPGADAIYDLSKLLGESVCLARENTRIARLSNVFGKGQSAHTFLGSVLRDLKKDKKVIFREAPQSSKDYISIDDTVKILEQIAVKGKEKIYNVAGGKAITHDMLAKTIRACGYAAEFSPGAPVRTLPPVDIERIAGEFGAAPRSILEELPRLLQDSAS